MAKIDPNTKIDFWERAVENACNNAEKEMHEMYTDLYSDFPVAFSRFQFDMLIYVAKIMVGKVLLDEKVREELTDPSFPQVIYGTKPD